MEVLAEEEAGAAISGVPGSTMRAKVWYLRPFALVREGLDDDALRGNAGPL